MPFRKAPRSPHGILTIEGECDRPTHFSYEDLLGAHVDYQVPDVSKVDQRLKGVAVRLRTLLDEVGPSFHSKWITVESEDGKFSASLPLKDTRATALVIYGLSKKALERDAGGPVRFVIPFHPDDCTKVKGATRMVLSEERGRDTRPSNAAEHREIHKHDA
jgi:DMSO/TMAO reductase YedYZ molybdopterin-dependent catalytic subunit